MVNLKFIFILFFLGFYSCSPSPTPKYPLPPITLKLHSMAMDLVPYINNNDSCLKAIKLLDSATSLDSNYFLAYYNKVMFLNTLNEYGKAIVAIKNSIRIKPEANDLYMLGGLLYEKVSDSLLAAQYFRESLNICNKILDTMSKGNSDYLMLMSNKVINLIMLGNHSEANKLLKKIYENETDESEKNNILETMSATKAELINKIFSAKRQ